VLGPVWTGMESLTAAGFRTLDRPPFSELLYRLRHPCCHTELLK